MEKEEISIACIRLLLIKFLFHLVRFLTWTFYQYSTERIMIYNRLYTGEYIKIRIVLQNLGITNFPCKIYNTRDNLS